MMRRNWPPKDDAFKETLIPKNSPRSDKLGSLKTLRTRIRFRFILLATGFLLVIVVAAALLGATDKQRLFYFPHYDGPPRDLVVHGKRDKYTPVPEQFRRRFFTEKKGKSITMRAFHNRGWTLGKNQEDAQVYYVSKNYRGSHPYEKLKPWQRFARVPGFSELESKDKFQAGFQRYKQTNPLASLYFLPQTFRLEEETDKEAFRKRLEEGNGMNQPWVLKNANLNNGAGIEMLGPNSEALKTAITRAEANDEYDYIIQQYVCNELTWFNGEKFDLRFYMMIASVDPPIVLYHDGFVRVGAAAYNESDFSSTGQHLTNHKYRAVNEAEVTKDFLWKRIREHFDANSSELSKKVKIDPVQHVRNQMKEALATTAAAFRDVLFENPPRKKIVPENLFGFYGVDFVIDRDLDVWCLEVQSSPGLGDKYDYRIGMFNDLFRPMVDIVEEISIKQETDSKANLLPLENLGDWEIVYAGDWKYEYKGYERLTNKKSCSVGA